MRLTLAFCLLTTPALAETRQIFAQEVDFQPPPGFALAFSQDRPPSALYEFLPPGETLEVWDQMVTLTGAQGAGGPGPEAFAQALAEGFYAVCPQSLASIRLSDPQIPGAQGVFAAFLACGDNGAGQSESVVFLVLQGTSDIYTVQWAERGPRQPGPPAFDAATWYPRLADLARVALR